MRTIPSALAAVIAGGDFTGPRRSTTRVTIQKVELGLYVSGSQVYSSPLFPTVGHGAMELPNIKSLSWDRSTQSEVAGCTMELWNTSPMPPGALPDTGDTFDLLGYYTYNRGKTSYSQTTWGHTENQWQDMLVPDRMLRVYQGYGADYSVYPENDPNLVCTGIWLIDDVTYSADGTITVESRDLGRLLIDQMMFPPVVPYANYPLKFEKINPTVANDPTPVAGSLYTIPTTGASSAKTVQFGHPASNAFDFQIAPVEESYWLSAGHTVPDHPSSFEWIEGNLGGVNLTSATVSVRGGPYRVYLSIYTDKAAGGKITGWNGIMNIPYDPGLNTTDNGSKITYSKTGIVNANSHLTLTTTPVAGVTKIRFTFTNLYNSLQGSPYVYRVAVRGINITQGVVEMVSQGTHSEGNYDDYAQIVELLLAYGGFYWPAGATQYLTSTNTVNYVFAQGNSYLARPTTLNGIAGSPNDGTIYGDVKMSGTYGPAPLGIEVWDKKPLMDGINYVKDILGYSFWIDENGGAVFRPPNYYKLGNYKVDQNGMNAAYVTDYVTLRDDEAILGLRSKLSSRQMREKIFVANVTGQFGALAEGIIRYPSGFRRVGGWTDQNFASSIECQIMADLISIRQMFTYRTNSIRIPANPAMQIEDQVKVLERTTGEAYFHYISGITSQWEAASGEWTYDLTTSWLGDSPSGTWAVPIEGLSPETIKYLQSLNQI